MRVTVVANLLASQAGPELVTKPAYTPHGLIVSAPAGGWPDSLCPQGSVLAVHPAIHSIITCSTGQVG